MGLFSAIGAVAGLASGLLGSSAAKKAGNAQVDATREASALQREGIQLQRDIFDQTRADYAPWREAGSEALGTLRQMVQPGYNADQLATDPGYQFRFNEGRRAIDSSRASRGVFNSGATLKALTNYGQEQGTNEYGARFNRLATLAGYGQNATGATANAGTNFGNAAQQGFTNIGNNTMQAGNARASSYVGSANAFANGLNSASSFLTLSQLLGKGA